MLSQIPEDAGSDVVISVKSTSAPASPTNGQKSGNKPEYDPSIVYILEFCTVLALRDADTVQLLSKRMVGALQAILRDVGSYHHILVGRAAFYLLRLLQFSYVREMIPYLHISFAIVKHIEKDEINQPNPFYRSTTFFALPSCCIAYPASPKTL